MFPVFGICSEDNCIPHVAGQGYNPLTTGQLTLFHWALMKCQDRAILHLTGQLAKRQSSTVPCTRLLMVRFILSAQTYQMGSFCA